MGTTAPQASAQTGVGRRRVPRYPVAVPLDVTVLRSGVPDSVPGRSLDVGEGGVGAVLAAELRSGEPVGVEFRLPYIGLPLRAKAVVRHEARLRYGLEFLGLSVEQQAMLRYWAQRAPESRPLVTATEPLPSFEAAVQPEADGAPVPDETPFPPQYRASFQRMLWALAVALLLGALLGWWHWQRAWKELEAQLPRAPAATEQPRVKVPAEVMAPLITHKVEPVYPEEARPAHLQGLVVLDAVIGRDGAVLDLRRVSGPDVLARAAMDAVKWWRFQPYRVNGQPVEVETTVAVAFQP